MKFTHTKVKFSGKLLYSFYLHKLLLVHYIYGIVIFHLNRIQLKQNRKLFHNYFHILQKFKNNLQLWVLKNIKKTIFSE